MLNSRVKRVSVVEEYSRDDERLLKRVLMKYLNSPQIKNIFNITLLVHEIYPCIVLEWATNKSSL